MLPLNCAVLGERCAATGMETISVSGLLLGIVPARWKQVMEWRDRAEGLRRAAEDFGLPSAHDGLIEAAEGYERMADELERKLKTLGIQQPPSP